MTNFEQPICQEILDITDKHRSNLFAWRGQFSPQLIESILKAYCLPDSVILDPFVGSGTVLLEAGNLKFQAYGVEINPAAFIISKNYELINHFERTRILKDMRKIVDREFPFQILQAQESEIQSFKQKIINIHIDLAVYQYHKMLFDSLIILSDLDKNKINNNLIQQKFTALAQLITSLPYSEQPIKVSLGDARAIPLKDKTVDFVITSPPYINVFNYHQNYRKSAELLGWNLLNIAKSEIGSNRANRGNRFYTVIQYCLDMADVLKEISRVSKKNARIVLVVGYESKVLGVPFYNADIITRIGIESGLFKLVLKQQRTFKNKFGKIIREDLINFLNLSINCRQEIIEKLARNIALDILKQSLASVPSKNLDCLADAITKVYNIEKTPKLLQTQASYQSH